MNQQPPPADSSPLGIIAGEGQFPLLVAQGARRLGRPTIGIAFKEHTRPELSMLVEHITWLRLGQLSKMLAFFAKHQVREVVFAGGINKPRALALRPDLRAAKLLFHLRSKNDNSLLQALVGLLETEGFTSVSALHFVPSLRTPAGVLTKREPTRQEKADIEFGWPVGKKIGDMDIGQCVVIRDQMVVAVEAIEGTNETISRAGRLGGKGCVVVKTFKPGQEEHIDQPAVGLETVRTMIRAQATCLAVEADKSLFFDRQQTLEVANEAKICIVGYHPGLDL
ncbi:LpxI family protein [Desulfovermiculus halophilus]|uniref:LpxI family protein n=1 Tax=Desulfovermiculus halophilus TaxID=339722 RepID=UPI000487660B|nr:UDP-2,3-diacylglucosamine diphosphatase LpxI [Desulfovermiculus halophilus]